MGGILLLHGENLQAAPVLAFCLCEAILKEPMFCLHSVRVVLGILPKAGQMESIRHRKHGSSAAHKCETSFVLVVCLDCA